MKTILCFILPILFGILFKSSSANVLNHQTSNNPYLLYRQSVRHKQSIHEISKASRSLHTFNSDKVFETGSLGCHGFLSMAMEGLTTEALTGEKLWKCIEALPVERRKIVATHLENALKLIGKSLSVLSYDENANKTIPTPNKAETTQKQMAPNVVVAKDGSGKYKTIDEAIKIAPSWSNKRFVIYVKKGVYNERVVVPREKQNVMMYGDGMARTIVTGSVGTKDPTRTPDTVTFTVWGNGFIARDMAFQNTYAGLGPGVALRSASDRSVFYRCRMDGYQDTLWTDRNRQFYRECEIRGTIDFIFGNAAVVIQKSSIVVKKPLLGQYNVISSQGKVSRNSGTGLAIQSCNIYTADNLSGVKTYLGRPWKLYSTAAYIQSAIGGFVHPQGWISGKGDANIPSTVTFVEYRNTGPGSSTNKRIGLGKTGPVDVRKFTVKSLISGDQWLPATGVPFKAGL